jgi:hypothetical protein
MKNYSVAAMNPDVYLCALYEEFPAELLDVIIRLTAGKRCPPLTPGDICDAPDRVGVTEFASRTRARLV